MALSVPVISVGFCKTDATEALSNCRQLQIVVGDYFKRNNRPPTSLSALHAEGIIDIDLFEKLTGSKGLYLIYFRDDMKKDDLFIEAFLPKVHVAMTAGGDGMFTPIKYHNQKQK